MELRQHAILYIISIIVLSLFWEYTNLPWWFYITLIPAFLINPDIDFILKNFGVHRWGITHSIFLPLSLYFSIRPYISFESLSMFSLWLFFPVIIHLIGDLKITSVIGAVVDDIKESTRKKKISQGNQETGGSYQISLFPLSKKRLPFYWTIGWLIGNIVIMIIIVVVV